MALTTLRPLAFLQMLLLGLQAMVLVPAAIASQKIALVIGNAAYVEGALDNPVRDAAAVAGRLRGFGFDVVEVRDGSLADMQMGLLEFVDRIEKGATALVFYAGHGIQANGRNYLLPVEATLQSESALRFQAMEVVDILEELERSGSRMNIVVLDACRNNPFERKMRGGARGLAVVDAAAGTLIAYATAPGSVASDGDGVNGLYTQELLKALDQPGLKVEEVFKRVRSEVSRRSGGAQVPWESSSLTGDLVFNDAGGAVPALDVDATSAGSVAPVVSPEMLFWSTIQESRNPSDFEDYLTRFPNGTFRSLAERRVETLAWEGVAGSRDPNEIQAFIDQYPDGETLAMARARLGELNASPPRSCDDLSGRWYVPGASCEDTLTLTSTGPGAYKGRYEVCGTLGAIANPSGKATLDGGTLVFKWLALPCSGTTNFTFDENCDRGRMRVMKRGGIPGLCAVFVKKGTEFDFYREGVTSP